MGLNINEGISKLSNTYVEMVSRYPGRETDILAVFTALITKEPLILIGPPGIAKTSIIDELASRLDLKFFRILLTKYTQPEELFGPYDISALREGKLVRRSEGYMLDANIVFLDEVWNASSVVRNALLDIIEKRRYNMTPLNIVTVYGASNFAPLDREDQAFYDRFLRKFYDRDNQMMSELWDAIIDAGLKLFNERANGVAVPKLGITLTDLDDIYKYIITNAVGYYNKHRQVILQLLEEFVAKNIEISDRRKIKLPVVATAVNTILGLPLDDITGLYFAVKFVAQNQEDDAEKIRDTLLKLRLFPYDELALQVSTLVIEATNIIKEFDNRLRSQPNTVPTDVTPKFAPISEKVSELMKSLDHSSNVMQLIYREELAMLKRIKLEIEKRRELVKQMVGV